MNAGNEPASKKPDFEPAYRFNSEDLWLNQGRQASRIGDASRLSRWMIQRAAG